MRITLFFYLCTEQKPNKMDIRRIIFLLLTVSFTFSLPAQNIDINTLKTINKWKVHGLSLIHIFNNQEKRKKMKKTRYAILVLLSSLLTLVGCSRREILDDYPVTGINIRLNWEGVTDRLPEGCLLYTSYSL